MGRYTDREIVTNVIEIIISIDFDIFMVSISIIREISMKEDRGRISRFCYEMKIGKH